jgi:hypothetical protein
MLQQQQKLAAQARSGHISLIAGAEFNSEKKLTLTINEKAPSAQLWFTNHPGVKKFSVYLPPSNLTPTVGARGPPRVSRQAVIVRNIRPLRSVVPWARSHSFSLRWRLQA